MEEGQIWLILFGISLCINGVVLLWRPVLKLLRRKDQVSEDNIMAMVEEGEESGAIQTNEKEFIENVLEFDNSTAKDVMIHRTDMVTLPVDAEEEAILDVIRQSGLSRFPVYGEDADDIVGVLSTRDYLLNFHQPSPLPLKELLRPAYFVPETVAADVLFRDMQGKKDPSGPSGGRVRRHKRPGYPGGPSGGAGGQHLRRVRPSGGAGNHPAG